jgi:hypothetical protein
VTLEFPQWAMLMPRLIVGDKDKVWPVHASRPFLWVTIQSTVPSRCNTENEVIGDFVEMSAVNGVVEDMRWYRKGIPRAALRKGSSIDNVDCAWNLSDIDSQKGGSTNILCLSTNSH